LLVAGTNGTANSDGEGERKATEREREREDQCGVDHFHVDT